MPQLAPGSLPSSARALFSRQAPRALLVNAWVWPADACAVASAGCWCVLGAVPEINMRGQGNNEPNRRDVPGLFSSLAAKSEVMADARCSLALGAGTHRCLCTSPHSRWPAPASASVTSSHC